MAQPQPATLSAQSLRWIPLVIAVAIFMESLDSTIVGVAIPTMAHSFQIDPVKLKLAMTSYMISLAVFIPISGWLADKYQAKRVLAAAIVIFIFGSLLCALSPNLYILIASRIVQGFGGALLLPVGRLILLRSFSKGELVRVFSLTIVPALIGPALGPTIGGLILMVASWHWIFLVNLPVGIIGTILTCKLLPSETVDLVKAFDWLGFILFSTSMAAIASSLAILGEGVSHWQYATLWAVISILFYSAYYYYAKNQEQLIFNWRLFKIPSFKLGMLCNFLTRLTLAPTPFLLPLLLQLVWHETPLVSGLFFIPHAIGLMSAKALPIPSWLRRYGFRTVVLPSLCLFGLTALQMIWFTSPTSFVGLAILLFFQGLFASTIFSQLGPLTLLEVPPPDFSQASSMTTIMQQFAGATGIAIAAVFLYAFSHTTGHVEFSSRVFFWCYLITGIYAVLALLPMLYLSKSLKLPDRI